MASVTIRLGEGHPPSPGLGITSTRISANGYYPIPRYLSGVSNAFFQYFRIYPDGRVESHFDSSDAFSEDLTSLWERQGGFRISIGGRTLRVGIQGADTSEPYNWVATNTAAVAAFIAHVSSLSPKPTTGTLLISDNIGAGTPDPVMPNVSIETLPHKVNGGTAVNLRATSDDPDGSIVSFLWSSPGGVFSSTSIEDSTWTAPASTGRDVSYVLTLLVTDNDGDTASSSVTITVSGRSELITRQTIEKTGPEVLFVNGGFTSSDTAFVPVLIDPVFIEGNAVAYLTFASVLDSPPNMGLQLRLSSTPASDSLGAGPNFKASFETHGTITFVENRGVVTSRGTGSDSAEPYSWSVRVTQEIIDQFDEITDQGNIARVILDDSSIPYPAVTYKGSVAASAGVPTASISGRFIPEPVAHQGSVSATAGIPSVSVSGRDAPVRHGQFAASAGIPTVVFSGKHNDEPIAYSDWDILGRLEAETLFLVECAAPSDIFARDPRGNRGKLIDISNPLYDRTVGSSTTSAHANITRVRITDGFIILNDNDSPGLQNLGTYFQTGGAGADLSLYIQTYGGIVKLPVSGAFSGGNFVRFSRSGMTAAQNVIISSLVSGKRVLIALARDSATTTHPGSISATAGIPTATVGGKILPFPIHYGSVSAKAGAPTVAISGRIDEAPTAHQGSVAASAGNPTVAVSGKFISKPPVTHQGSISATAGNPAVAIGGKYSATPVKTHQGSVAATSGNPTVAIKGRFAAAPVGHQGSVAASAGAPTVAVGGKYRAEPVAFSDWDPLGNLETETLFLVGCAAPSDIFARPNRGTRGQLIDTSNPLYDRTLGASNSPQTNINRIRVFSGAITINESNDPGALNLSTYFRGEGGGKDLSLYFQTSAGVVQLPASTADIVGGNYITWNRGDLSREENAIIGSLVEGQRVLVAFARDRTTPPHMGSVAASAGNPTASVGGKFIPGPVGHQGSVSATAGVPTVTIGGNRVPSPLHYGSIAATTGNPTATVGGKFIPKPPVAHNGSIAATAGNPAVSVGGRFIPEPVEYKGSVAATAGNPTVSVGGSRVPSGLHRGSVSATAGIPTVSISGKYNAEPIDFSDWDPLGNLEADTLFLLECAGQDDIFARTPRGTRGDLIDTSNPLYDLTIGPSNTLSPQANITRVRILAGQIIVNDDNTPGSLALSTYFLGVGGGTDLSLYFQTRAGVVELPASEAAVAGGNFITWNRGPLSTEENAIIDSLVSGQRVLIAFARDRIIPPLEGSVAASAGIPTVTVGGKFIPAACHNP